MRGLPKASLSRYDSTSGSGSVTGESHTITPGELVGVEGRGGDGDEAAHAVADDDRLARDAAGRRRRPSPRRSTARCRSASRWSLSPWPGQVEGHHPELVGERRRDVGPPVGVGAAAVHEHQAAPARLAPGQVVDRGPADLHLAVARTARRALAGTSPGASSRIGLGGDHASSRSANASTGGATYQAPPVDREKSVSRSAMPSSPPAMRRSIRSSRATVGAEGHEHQTVLEHATEGRRASEHLELLAVVVLDHDAADVGSRRADIVGQLLARRLVAPEHLALVVVVELLEPVEVVHPPLHEHHAAACAGVAVGDRGESGASSSGGFSVPSSKPGHVPAGQVGERRLLSDDLGQAVQRPRDGPGDVEDGVRPAGVQPDPQVVLVGGEGRACRPAPPTSTNGTSPPADRSGRIRPQSAAPTPTTMFTPAIGRREVADCPSAPISAARRRRRDVELEVVVGTGANGEDARLRSRGHVSTLRVGSTPLPRTGR